MSMEGKENRDTLLQEQRRLMHELQRIEAALTPASNGASRPGGQEARFADFPPGKAIRKLVTEEGRPCTRATIVWELIAGKANVGSKYSEENILRAIDVNLELGLLVEIRDKIGLPEWQNNERPRHRMAKDSRIRFLIEKIHTDLNEQFSIGQLAQSVQLSPSRLSRLFQKEVGMTPLEYLRLVKMRVVRHMLRTTTLKQKQILAITGITDRSHFSRQFKRLFRKSPSQIRARAGTGSVANLKIRA